MNRGPTWDPRTVYAGPTYYSGGAHMGPTRYSGETHVRPTRYSGGTHVGPTRYSGGTHVGPTVLLSELFYLKKLFSFHYLTIQNIFNYFLHIKIITKLCILHSHMLVLLLFDFGFPSVNSQNILERFIHF